MKPGLVVRRHRRFVEDHRTIYNDADLRSAKTVDSRWPCVAILACAESRVPVGMIFNVHIRYRRPDRVIPSRTLQAAQAARRTLRSRDPFR